MKVEVDARGSPSLIVPTVSADVKQYWTGIQTENRPQELCESGGGRPELPAPK